MKRMTIEAALGWAYRQELPKSTVISGVEGGIASSWRAVSSFAALWTKVDAPPVINDFGCVVAFGGDGGAPHPDALVIADAVSALDDAEFGLPDGWNPLDDFTGYDETGDALMRAAVDRGVARLTVVDGEGRRALKTTPSRLVSMRASLGGEPDWRGERPEVREVRGANGKARWFRRVLVPVAADGGWIESEVDGWDERRRRPRPDAYLKHFLDPDPMALVVARGEWEIWRAALELLGLWLSETGLLAEVIVEPSIAPARPWLGDRRKPPRVLRALHLAQSSIPPSRLRGRSRRAARAS